MSDYYPNPIDTERVIRLKRAGILNHRIADILRISLEELEKYYPVELGFTDEEDLAIVANMAFTMACSGQDANMTKWWLAVKGGWNEKTAQQSGLESPLLIVLADGTESTSALIEDAEFTEIDPQ